MKLLYATSIGFPSPLANRIQTLAMAEAFCAILKDDFVFGFGWKEGDMKINCHHIEMGKGLKSYRLAWKYLRFAKESGITTVYCREEKLLFFFILYRSIFYRELDIIYEVHYLVYLKHFWYRVMLRKMLGVVSITHGMKDILIKNGFCEENIIVAPDAVSPEMFSIKTTKEKARARLGLPSDKKIILYTGSITQTWKGAPLLIECARLFGDEFLFVIVGGKSHHLDKFRKTYNPGANVLTVGQKSHEDIPEYLQTADVLVLPNSNKEEISRTFTSPMKLFEYMMAEKPIVASDIDSVREVLNKKNAMLVKPDDAEALAAGIRLTLESPAVTDALVRQAKKDVALCTWENRAKKIITAIAKWKNKK